MKSAGDLEELLPEKRLALQRNTVPFIKSVHYLICSMQFFSMSLLVIQHTGMPFLVRATNKDRSFLPTTCVFFMEILKLSTCSIMVLLESGGVASCARSLHDAIWQKKMETLKVCIPAFAYAIQNNLYYIALANIDATTYTVTYQLRILTTALLSVLMLGKEISRCQWGALTLSGYGVILVQMDVTPSNSTNSIPSASKFVGVMATIGMCWTSAFAGVYFEKMLKNVNSNMWIQNIRLSLMTLVFATFTMWSSDGQKIMERWTSLVWTMTIAAATSGIVVSAVMKYADNVKKTYCQTLAIGKEVELQARHRSSDTVDYWNKSLRAPTMEEVVKIVKSAHQDG
ncbi:UDP-galactose transporter [Teladorsagia circumcincta]|uniref:UDP-galactose transporter n=1 Tax=Teladorsagia circumcincta TaxID=45464 RepID=A0A2G9U948_TELCI|nr:UDP-galactose transporter [Teladorsagia circumcincta]